MLGRQISHYRIVEKLGEGGMGVVYRAEDTTLQRTVALKFLPAQLLQSSEARERFAREARAAAALEHPSICPIYEMAEAEGLTFIAMSYVDGETLSLMIQRAPLDLKDIISWAIQVAEGLEEAHRNEIVHRDIKSANVMVNKRGQAKILDFGLARTGAGRDSTRTGTVMGTVNYMSPEQVNGEEVDRRTDIWSFGVVIFEMATGKTPFARRNMRETMRAICEASPPALSELRESVPNGLQAIVFRALAKRPADRYQTVSDMMSDLRSLQAETTEVTFPRDLARLAGTASVAVLPFVNLGPDKQDEYFSDGLTEELITALGGLDTLRVVSRTSAFEFKGKSENVQKIGLKLRVTAVVEGSVRQAGNRLRINVQLVNVADGYQLWSQRYDREAEDVFAIQEEIAASVVEALRVRLVEKSERPLVKPHTRNLEAHNLYLKGRYYLNQETLEGFQKARECFEEALAQDERFAPAHSGLADFYTMMGFYGAAPPQEVWPQAEEFTRKALKIDPSLADAHASLARVLAYYHWDWRGAEKEFSEALDLNPNNGDVRYHYALYVMQTGNLTEAMRQMEYAWAVDPLSPYISSGVAWVYYYQKRYDRAVRECLKTIDLNPNYFEVYGCLGLCHLARESSEESVRAFRKADELSGSAPLAKAFLAYAHGVSGAREEASALLDELLGCVGERYVCPVYLAVAYLGLGEQDVALEWLEKGYDARDATLLYLRILPVFDCLRSDRRFQSLLERIGFMEEDRTTALVRPPLFNTAG